MDFESFFSKQARKPAGMFGRFYMSRVFEKGNRELNEMVKGNLFVGKNDRVLEIGFGTGMVIKSIADNLDKGVIEGVDFSKSMAGIARRKNRKHIRNGKVKILLGDFDELEFEENSFDKIFSVNTIYFWKNPEATIGKIFKLLKPGGKIVLGFHEKSEMEKMPLDSDVFMHYTTRDMRRLLSLDGSMDSVDIISKEGAKKICYCAVGTKYM